MLTERFQVLTRFLEETRPLWSQRPFTQLVVDWEYDFPEMAAGLRKLSTEEIDACEAHPWTLANIPEPFKNLSEKICYFSRWPSLLSDSLFSTLPRPPRIKARKWQQIRAFIEVVREDLKPLPDCWLDWCSGKGHLGRSLAKITSKQVICVEKDSELCRSGLNELNVLNIPGRFICADVLTEDPLKNVYIEPENTAAVALHACGQLNIALLKLCVEHSIRHLAVVPCCYQRIQTEEYKPLSVSAHQASLTLHKNQLRLLAFQEHFINQRARARRHREQAWRLAVDLLHRESTGVDAYRPLGSVPDSWLRGSFEKFCDLISERGQFVLPPGFDVVNVEHAGFQRLKTSRALGLVRGLFRRPLESWLMMDRILYMQESGYYVRAGTFCDEIVTPRNLMLIACR